MGSGFETFPMPEEMNQAYFAELFLCIKWASAVEGVIAGVAERTAQQTGKEVEDELGLTNGVGSSTNTAGGVGRNGKSGRRASKEYEVDRTMSAEQTQVWEDRRQQEEAFKASQRDREDIIRERKDATNALRERLASAHEEKERLLKENMDWQKQISQLMALQQKKREDNRGDGRAQADRDAPPVRESEKQYSETLTAILDTRERFRSQEDDYDKNAIDLQARLDEKEFKAREISDSFRDFKREIARTAENSRTGKAIPKRVIMQFEALQGKKDAEIEKVRLKNINLRMTLKKLETQLRSKEQLAEGLHLIDFEQLKIENQTLNEKIEERNEELHKLRRKNTTTVQMLTHIKEKLQFVANENEIARQRMAERDAEVIQERDKMTRAKRERDALRADAASLRQSQGFANSDLLIVDYDQRRADIKALKAKIEAMKEKNLMFVAERDNLARAAARRTA